MAKQRKQPQPRPLNGTTTASPSNISVHSHDPNSSRYGSKRRKRPWWQLLSATRVDKDNDDLEIAKGGLTAAASLNHPSVCSSSPRLNSSPRNKKRRPKQRLLRYTALAAAALIVVLLSSSSTTVTSTANTIPPEDQHPYAIPPILIFTHRYNLLDPNLFDTVSNLSVEERAELQALQANVQHTIQILSEHHYLQVRFLTDKDCLHSLVTVLGPDSPLVEYFQSEKKGMYKADICRAAALAETGGWYFDVDVGVRLDVWQSLRNPSTTDFVTARVHLQSTHPGAYFQAVWGCRKGHDLLYRYLEWFVAYYEEELEKDTEVMAPGSPLGVILLKRAIDEWMIQEEEHMYTVNRTQGASAAAALPRFHDTTEIWQEVLYLPELYKTVFKDVPPPVFGQHRACHFVVVSQIDPMVVVPLYSRVPGSRLCPAGAIGSAYEELAKELGITTTVPNTKK